MTEYRPGSRPGERVLAGRVGTRLGDDPASAVEQLDQDAGQRGRDHAGTVAVPVRIGQPHGSLERRREDLTEVVFDPAQPCRPERPPRCCPPG